MIDSSYVYDEEIPLLPPSDDLSLTKGKAAPSTSPSILTRLFSERAPSVSPTSPYELFENPKEILYDKMHRNGEKAIDAGYKSAPKSKAFIAENRDLPSWYFQHTPNLGRERSGETLLPSVEEIFEQKERPIRASYTVDAKQGLREYMEDAHFILNTKEGMLAAIFDGHSGSYSSNAAARFFRANFTSYLKKAKGMVGTAFSALFKDAQKNILNGFFYKPDGSTAVLCYIDYSTHAVYTATLGDSEARIYRQVDLENDLLSIALSCVRDWSSKKDAKRAADYYNLPIIAEVWPFVEDSKLLRVEGLNVSRALGDQRVSAVSSKEKLSINMLKSQDYLIIACDGLWDFVTENEIETILRERRQDKASALTAYTLDIAKGSDNVTIIVIEIF